MVHDFYPEINVLQLEAGAITGWVFHATIGPYTISAGHADKTLLYEGKHNENMLHIGFILNHGYSAVAEAHKYTEDSLSIDYGAAPLHEVYPANMSWASVYATKEIIMKDLSFPTRKLEQTPHIIIGGERKDLDPLSDIISYLLKLKPNATINEDIETELQKTIYNLLTKRMMPDAIEQPFTEGDKYRMQLLEKTHKLSQDCMCKPKPISLKDICEITKMKPRTLQKYFNETYGLGPTEYFRTRRLNNAHIDLLKSTDNISEIALRWKFPHLGRFAKTYKNFFGESPSRVQVTK